MKFQLRSSGISVSDSKTTLLIDPSDIPSRPDMSFGLLFTRPYTEESLRVLKRVDKKIFAVISAGECEIGSARICSYQTDCTDTVELVHMVEMGGIFMFFCGSDASPYVSEKIRGEVGDMSAVVIAVSATSSNSGKNGAQNLYTFGLSFSPEVLIFLNAERSDELQKIGGDVRTVRESYAVKRKDIEKEGVSVILVTR